jgi:hypothetical protein
MLLVGEAPVYLSHLPMFMAPHNFQVILEVTLDAEASRHLGDFRAHFGRDDLYTVKPEQFSLADLLPVDPAKAILTDCKADVFKGHFEKGGDVIVGGATIHVNDVVHFEELGSADKAADLEYILFGAEQRLFLAHRITRQPDFDQVVSCNATGHRFTEDELRGVPLAEGRFGVLVTIPGRSNTSSSRIKPGEKASGRGHVVGAHQFLDIQVEVLSEIYFEEGELREKATFSPTKEEEAAGLGEEE